MPYAVISWFTRCKDGGCAHGWERTLPGSRCRHTFSAYHFVPVNVSHDVASLKVVFVELFVFPLVQLFTAYLWSTGNEVEGVSHKSSTFGPFAIETCICWLS